MENYEQDEEMKKSCKQTLAAMSSTPMFRHDIPVFIDVFEKVSSYKQDNSYPFQIPE